jgi:hypothetical protein
MVSGVIFLAVFTDNQKICFALGKLWGLRKIIFPA